MNQTKVTFKKCAHMRDNSSTFPSQGGERESLDHRTTHYSSVHSTNICIYVKPTMCQALSRHGEFRSNQDSKSLSSWAIYKIRTLCSPKSGYIPVREFPSSPVVLGIRSWEGNQTHVQHWGPAVFSSHPHGSVGWMETQHGNNIAPTILHT